MRIAVITCEAYKDAVGPFKALFDRFWPNCPYPVGFYSDFPSLKWCEVVALTAEAAGSESILMLLDDFFLTAPVQTNLVEYALDLLNVWAAGCVRLFPMPGGEAEFADSCFALVPKGTVGRISCQAAIWNPEYLRQVARGAMTTTSEAGDFENLGSVFAEGLDAPVLAWRRGVEPWPMDYLCSAISRGKWNPDAIKLCEQYGVPMDLSRRPVEA